MTHVYVVLWENISCFPDDAEEVTESTLLGAYTTEAAALTRAQAQAEFFQVPWPAPWCNVNTPVGIRTAYQCDASTTLAIYQMPLDEETDPASPAEPCAQPTTPLVQCARCHILTFVDASGLCPRCARMD